MNYTDSQKMRQKLIDRWRQNVCDRLANDRTINFHHGQTGFIGLNLMSNSRFLRLQDARWYTPNSFKEWLWLDASLEKRETSRGRVQYPNPP